MISIVFKDKTKKQCCNNLFEVVGKSFNILCNELSKYEWEGTDYLLDIKLPSDIGLLDKSKMNYIYNEGYTQAKSRIKEIKYKLKL